MSNVQRLRTQALFDSYDQLTPGASSGGGGFGGFGGDFGYGDETSNPSSPYTPGPSGLESVAAQQDANNSGTILGPDGQPLDQRGPTIQTATLDPITLSKTEPTSRESFQDYIKMMNEGYTP